MEADPPSAPFGKRHPRVNGAILLLVALAIAKWQIYDPLHSPGYGGSQFHIWPKLILASIGLGLVGAIQCIFGPRLSDSAMPVDFNDISWKMALACLGFAALGIAIYICVMMSLTQHGYVVPII